jgi:glycerol-3-phosphate dehydrogenase subunit B
VSEPEGQTPDVVVIGGGVAGLAAALAARDAGAAVTVVDAHAGASVLAGGAWDVATDVRAGPEDVFRPPRSLAQQLVARARSDPHHPYAVFGHALVEAVEAAHARVLDALGIYRPLDLRGTGVLVATDLGLCRRAATAQRAVLDLGPLRGETIAVAVLRAYRGCDAAFAAASLAEMADLADDDRRFGAVDVEFFRRREDALLHPHELAALCDAPDGRARLRETLRRAVTGRGYAAVLVPPMLGIAYDTHAAELSEALGLQVGESVAALAGPQGLRLRRRIDAALAEAGVARLRVRVRGVETGPGGPRVVPETGEVLRPRAVVLATGKHVAGGVVVAGGEPREPLTGLPLYLDGRPLPLASSARGRDPVVFYGDDPFVGGPGFRVGIGFDTSFRALDASGKPHAARIYACGAVLAGTDPGRDGTGLGLCATTGWAAGRAAASG